MNIELGSSTLALARDGMLAVRDAKGTCVACLSGALWITEEHAEDTFLKQGQSFVLRRPGLALIMALTPASLRLSEQRETLAARAAAWLAKVLPLRVAPMTVG